LTIDAVKEAYPEQRIWAVFEPRSATARRKVFEESFPKSFLKANRVVFAEPFAPEKIKQDERLDVKAVVATICDLEGTADYIPQVDDIVEFIIKNSNPGDVVLVMSSGGFGGIHQKILEGL
jgi:UDP-N-acetylmuramate: L-alanyl-gamma-D-glutamyl-meso-diaminopimelate ligase